ncbi:MAG: NAD(P)-dependent oxidoreductase [Candidatus Sumerlaeota bacterium]|nr:NAD(P)-dependent oxidoreductase [Candidatus Sumerlaeota bacterium]
MTIQKIGFVGLGAMGRPMALRLLQAGYDLAVFDVREEAMEEFARGGARACRSGADAARGADVTFTIVPDSENVEQAVLGAGGVAEGARPGSLVVEMSTIDPAVTRKVGAELAARGIRMIDAAVCRSTRHAEEGKLLFVVGGETADYEAALPLLRHMGDAFHHCGPLGAGITMKLVNNAMAQSIAAVVCETLVLGAKAGLGLEPMVEILSGTAASNQMLTSVFPASAFRGDFRLGFALDWAAKDIGHALSLAARNKTICPLAAQTRQLLALAQAQGKGRQDFSALLTVFEEIAGVRLRTKE